MGSAAFSAEKEIVLFENNVVKKKENYKFFHNLSFLSRTTDALTDPPRTGSVILRGTSNTFFLT